MGDDFVAVNLDKRLYRPMDQLDYSLFDGVLGPLWYRQRCVPSEEISLVCDSDDDEQRKTPKKHDQRQSCLSRLPPEIFLIVLEFAGSLVVSAALGYTCRKYYDYARGTLQRQLNAQTWVGDRIAMFGLSTRLDDLPSHENFTDEEREFIESCLRRAEDRKARVAVGTNDPPAVDANTSSNSQDPDGVASTSDSEDSEDSDSAASGDSEDSNDTDDEFDDDEPTFEDFISRRCTDYNDSIQAAYREFNGMLHRDTQVLRYAEGVTRFCATRVHCESIRTRNLPKRVVLRNLTTREYYSVGSLKDAGVFRLCKWFDRVEGPLILRICWTSDHSTSESELDQALGRGPWACHRFDSIVVPKSKKKAREVLKGWTDVSQSIINDARALYKIAKEYGRIP